MIEKLRAMAIFAAVVDKGSFRAAAQHLALAPSRISQTVSELEKGLGVTLLYRSTRHLSLTHEGQILYSNVSKMLQAAESGLNAINHLSTDPTGELRVTAPAFITQTDMMDTFTDFCRLYPNVALKLNFTDLPQELIEKGFDVGIRAGWLKDSELMSRKVGYTKRLLVASPDYVESQRPTKHPVELESWDWIHFSMRPDRTELTGPDGEIIAIACKYHLEVDSANALFEFAQRGLGITILPDNLAKRGIRKGELTHLFPAWHLKPLELYAVWPDRSRRESLTIFFVRFLAERSGDQ